MDQYVDDCYCPAGVAHRTAGTVRAIQVGIGLAAAAATVQLLAWIGKAVKSAITFATQPNVLLTIAGAWLSFVALLVVGTWLLIGWRNVHYYGGEWYPVKFARFLWRGPAKVAEAIRVRVYQGELSRLIERRPEISEKTFEDILADMNDHHDHAPKREELIAYERAFRNVIRMN
mgnify:CR=1 FL=1